MQATNVKIKVGMRKGYLGIAQEAQLGGLRQELGGLGFQSSDRNDGICEVVGPMHKMQQAIICLLQERWKPFFEEGFGVTTA